MKNKTAYFAGGCFWGVQYLFQKTKGTTKTSVGYCGGNTENPTYEDICTGSTAHTETVKIEYDNTLTDYETLVKFFFEIHDPTQVNRQGPDVGTQYRSAIFYQTEEEKTIAQSVIKILEEKGFAVVTELVPFEKFWEAESYHQDYYFRKGQVPYCHIRKKIF